MIQYQELSSLEQDLGIPAKTLYALSNSLNRHYRKVRLPKKTGGCRELSVPDDRLKAVQRRITDVLLIHMPVSRYATAYRFGCSPLGNAVSHVGKQLVLKLDILRFFDSIRYSDVKDLAFPARIYSEQNRILLSMLCYYKDSLPQGAPSSPAISNLILYPFDERVGRWCQERRITYTRYCDDLTFSGEFPPEEVIAFVRRELKKQGFLLNHQKTRIQRQGQRQTVTGIVVNETPNLPREYRRKLRQELYYCQTLGVTAHLQKVAPGTSEKAYLTRLLGMVNYALGCRPNDETLLQGRHWLRQALQQQ